MTGYKYENNNGTAGVAVETAGTAGKHGFVHLFPDLEPCVKSNAEIDALAQLLTSRNVVLESDIPAGYTYLSQFIAHDISLDSAMERLPLTAIDPTEISNLKTPFFDLETIYGYEPPFKEGELPRTKLLDGLSRLKVGDTAGDGTGGFYKSFKNDLWRPPGDSKAVIVDQRNDGNVAVAQTQVSFARFHNAIVDRLNQPDTVQAFDAARRSTIRHYQWIVLHDFLPRIVKDTVLKNIAENGTRLFPRTLPEPVALPLEFSFGAFRFGHSMVAHLYQWNRLISHRPIEGSLANLSKFTHIGGGFKYSKKLASRWVINWKWFYDIDNSMVTEKANFNRSRRIDTRITPALGNFRGDFLNGYNPVNSLPALDLYRNRALGLPSGQSLARRMLKLGIPVNMITPEEFDGLLTEGTPEIRNAFRDDTPLWFYVLAEAEIEEQNGVSNGCLGDLGSRIVAETIIKLLELSPFSILKEEWEEEEWLGGEDGKFGMAEMLGFIAESDPDFLNPAALAPDPGKAF